MDIIKTICPRCLKIFNVSERIDEVKCNFCEYMYPLPKLVPHSTKTSDRDIFSANCYGFLRGR